MPYSIKTDHPDCASGYAVIKEETGELIPGGCHPTEAEAQAQITAINISEATRQDSYTPTEGMREEAERGLEWRREFGRGGTLIGVARARDIINGAELPLETVVRMRSYFARHEVDKQGQGWSPDQDGYPSAGRIAWALWGGDPGRTWANAIVEAAQDDDQGRSIIEEIELHHEIERRARLDYGTRKIGHRVEVHGLRRLADYEALRNGAPQASWQDADLLPVGHPRRTEETTPMARTKEVRTAAITEFEVRETETGGLRFSGYAALFDTPSQPLPFIETIAPGAFARALGRAAKGAGVIKLLHGHNSDEMLAATPTSLELSEDAGSRSPPRSSTAHSGSTSPLSFAATRRPSR